MPKNFTFLNRMLRVLRCTLEEYAAGCPTLVSPPLSFALLTYHFTSFWLLYSQVSVSKARAIIVLASDENADQVLFNFHFTDSSELLL